MIKSWALYYGSINQEHDCMHAFCLGCNPKAKNNDGLTARLIAKEEGHKPATKELRKAEKTFGKVV